MRARCTCGQGSRAASLAAHRNDQERVTVPDDYDNSAELQVQGGSKSRKGFDTLFDTHSADVSLDHTGRADSSRCYSKSRSLQCHARIWPSNCAIAVFGAASSMLCSTLHPNGDHIWRAVIHPIKKSPHASSVWNLNHFRDFLTKLAVENPLMNFSLLFAIIGSVFWN